MDYMFNSQTNGNTGGNIARNVTPLRTESSLTNVWYIDIFIIQPDQYETSNSLAGVHRGNLISPKGPQTVVKT